MTAGAGHRSAEQSNAYKDPYTHQLQVLSPEVTAELNSLNLLLWSPVLKVCIYDRLNGPDYLDPNNPLLTDAEGLPQGL